MFIEDIPEHFDQVRWTANGFTALWPAHADRAPSLTVRRGSTGVLVKCQVGCSFFEVVAGAHLQPIDFKYGSQFSASSPDFMDKTLAVMQQLTVGSDKKPETFEEVCDLALEPPVEKLVEAMMAYPDFIGMSFEDAMKMSVIAFDGPIWVMCAEEMGKYGNDWGDAREEIGRRLWFTWRTGKPGRAMSR